MIGKFRINQRILEINGHLLNQNSKSLNYSNISKEEIDSKIFDAVNGEISAKKLTDYLFPEKEPHIFISHSSKDVNLAIRLANTLHEKYDILSFIDSQLWNHIDYALKEMHEKYCRILNTKTYHYQKSNNLLSHMHTILSMALMRVMDNSDSVIFIESVNSIHEYLDEVKINPADAIENISETLSPWISSEVNFANNLKENGHKDRQYLLKSGMDSYSLNKGTEHLAEDVAMPKIIHDIDLTDFIEITHQSFRRSMTLPKISPIINLDMMYSNYHHG